MKKKKLFIIILIVLSLGSYGLYKVYDFFDFFVKDLKTAKTIHILPSDYLDLLNKKDIDTSEIQTAIFEKNKSPISDFLFKNKYFIAITKLNVPNASSLLRIIQLEPYPNETSFYGRFDAFALPNASLTYRITQSTSNYVLLNMTGGNIKYITKNDSLQAFYFDMKSFSIRYKNDGGADLFANENDDDVKSPTILVFKIHNRKVYLIYITVNDIGTKLQLSEINNIVSLKTN